MDLFSRIKNIIKSNIDHSEMPDIDINSYKDDYFEDSKEPVIQNEEEKRYYKILELEYGANFQKIKSAYKKLLKKYHPDRYINNPDKLKIATRVTKEINEAYNYFERKYL